MTDDIAEWLILIATLPWLVLSVLCIGIYYVLKMPFLLWRIPQDDKENHFKTNRGC